MLAQIAERASNFFEASERGQRLLRSGGSMKFFMGRHKKTEHELGGHRYVVIACHSDRPYFGITYGRPGKTPKEILHLYEAMGLTQDHALQGTCVSRVLDFTLAGEW